MIITSRATANPVYTTVKQAQHDIRHQLDMSRDPTKLKVEIETFENIINGLSGDIQNLTPEEKNEIKLENRAIVDLAADKQVTISLHESVLPLTTEESGTSTTTVLAKRLFPRTESVIVETSSSTVPVIESPNTTVPVVLGYVESELVADEVVDEVFDELDAEVEDVVQEPLATEQNGTIPYLSDGMIRLSKEAAANVNGLQAGLTTFSYNPLAELIESTRSMLIYYTSGNYANLNVALSFIANNANLAVEYKTLRNSIGGPDGLSGCVSQLDNFMDHTNRLAGLVLDGASPNRESTDDSTTEDIKLFDFSGGPSVIFSFDARKFRSAKYIVQATAVGGDRTHQVIDLYILHDNYHPYTREMAAMYTQDPFISYTTRLANNRVEVLATSNVANVDFVIHGTRLQIARTSDSYTEMSQQKIIENHELMTVYLDDGVDYISKQSASLLKPSVVANLARDFGDMLVNLSGNDFLALSLANQQAAILAVANTISSRQQEIQSAIDEDYQNFLEIRKLAEALDIAYNLTVAYTDTSGSSVPKVTLNNATVEAIEESAEE